MPLFSVVIPTYNRADLICKSIESVLSQTLADYEIIVVDNHSTDDTVSRLSPYLNLANFTLVVQEKNFERARSRNKGFEVATGRFITLLDSDDLLYPDCLADAAAYLIDHPDSRFFHCNYEIIDQNGKLLFKGSGKSPADPFRELANGNYISNIGLFIHSSVLETVRVDETPVLIGMEDYDFILHVLFHVKNIGYIQKVNCGVLQHPGRTLMVQDMPAIEARVGYFVRKNISGDLFREDFKPFSRAFISGNMLYLCGAAAIRGLSFKAFKYWLKAAMANVPNIFTLKFIRHFFVIIKYMFK